MTKQQLIASRRGAEPSSIITPVELPLREGLALISNWIKDTPLSSAAGIKRSNFGMKITPTYSNAFVEKDCVALNKAKNLIADELSTLIIEYKDERNDVIAQIRAITRTLCSESVRDRIGFNEAKWKKHMSKSSTYQKYYRFSETDVAIINEYVSQVSKALSLITLTFEP